MSLDTIGWLFTLGVLAHNAEEALWLPGWSAYAGRWHTPVGAGEFRFAVGVLSLCFASAALGASMTGPGSAMAYLMAGCVLTMVLNAVFPHLLATLLTRTYMPGTASAALFNLPLGTLYLARAFTERRIDQDVFIWTAPLTVIAIAGSLPLLFSMGRNINRVGREP